MSKKKKSGKEEKKAKKSKDLKATKKKDKNKKSKKDKKKKDEKIKKEKAKKVIVEKLLKKEVVPATKKAKAPEKKVVVAKVVADNKTNSSKNYNAKTAIAMIRKMNNAASVTAFVKGDVRITVRSVVSSRVAALSKKITRNSFN